MIDFFYQLQPTRGRRNTHWTSLWVPKPNSVSTCFVLQGGHPLKGAPPGPVWSPSRSFLLPSCPSITQSRPTHVPAFILTLPQSIFKGEKKSEYVTTWIKLSTTSRLAMNEGFSLHLQGNTHSLWPVSNSRQDPAYLSGITAVLVTPLFNPIGLPSDQDQTPLVLGRPSLFIRRPGNPGSHFVSTESSQLPDQILFCLSLPYCLHSREQHVKSTQCLFLASSLRTESPSLI